MEDKIAVIGIVVENIDNIPKLNSLLSEYGGETIVGRMGIPYRHKKVNIITIVVDSRQEIIDDLSKKIKKIEGLISNICIVN